MAELPDLLSSKDEPEPTLRDVMKALGMVTTRMTATKEKLSAFSRPTHEAPSPYVQMDSLHLTLYIVICYDNHAFGYGSWFFPNKHVLC